MFKEEKEKKLFMIGMSIVLVLVLLIGGTYAWLTLSLRGTKVNVLKAGNLSLILNDENSIGINQEKAVPMLDEVGEQLDPYHFTLENHGEDPSEYTIFLDDIDLEENETRMADDKIKYNLIKDEEKTTALLSTIGENPNRILDTGVIKGGQTITYDLRLWIDKDASNEVMGQVLRTKIRVVAVQTEEILEDAPEECFVFDSTTGTITDYLCVEGNTSDLPVLTKFAIPSKINDVTVTSIGRSAFRENNLTKVTIPDTVITIGGQAFMYNQLTNLTISDNIAIIDSNTFQFNQLTSVTIPNGVTTIGNSTFSNNKLTNIIIPDSVTSIGNTAFSNNELTNIIIPDSVTTIGSSAFAHNQLTSVMIPNSVTSIGSSAFINNQLPDSEAFIYNRNSDGNIDTTSLNSYGGANRDHVVIPNGITTIGSNAFYDCKINNVTIPNSVTLIKNGAFRNNQLISVTIPNGVLEIEEFTFYNNQLTSVTIPNTVTLINQYAFSNNQLTNIVIPSSVTSIGQNAFAGNQLISVTIPNSVISIGSGAFVNNQLPDDQAFIYNRNSDGSINTTSLNSYGGAKRDNIVIPEGVTSIGSMAFRDNQLMNIVIPSNVTSIGQYAFSNNQLTSIVIPEGITKIENLAFDGNQLTTVTISSSVTSIGNSAFRKDANNNPNLTKIINKTGRSFDWKSITGGSEAATFVTGTVVHSLGNITVSAS